MQQQKSLSNIRCFLGADENIGLVIQDLSADELVAFSPDYITPGSANKTTIKDDRGFFLSVTTSRVVRCIESALIENQWEVILFLDEPLSVRTMVRYGLQPERFIRHATQWICKLCCGVECVAFVKEFTLSEIYCIALEDLTTPSEEMIASLQFFDPDSQQDISLIGFLERNDEELIFHPQLGPLRGVTELLLSDLDSSGAV